MSDTEPPVLGRIEDLRREIERLKAGLRRASEALRNGDLVHAAAVLRVTLHADAPKRHEDDNRQ